MKKLFSLIAAIIILSCSTNNDSNGNSATTVVPLAPSNLVGEVVNTNQVNLSWTDISTNETGFKIQRKVVGGNYALVGTVPADITNFNDADVSLSTNFVYRVYAYNAAGGSLTYTNELTLSVGPFLPTVTTSLVEYVSGTSALGGGNVTSDGGTSIISKGVVWSTSPNPTIALTTKTNEGPNAGSYTSTLNLSMADDNYYVRAYATNSVGTSYGAQVIYNKHTATYEFDIKPIMATSCVSCHSQGNQYPDLDTYPNVVDSFANGTSLCRLAASCGNIMPTSAPLPQSQINLIIQWRNLGYIQQ